MGVGVAMMNRLKKRLMGMMMETGENKKENKKKRSEALSRGRVEASSQRPPLWRVESKQHFSFVDSRPQEQK